MPDPHNPGPKPSAATEIVLTHTTVGLLFLVEDGLPPDRQSLSEIGVRQIVDDLCRLNLHATFCFPARQCERQPDRLRSLDALGHEIGVLGYGDESPRDLNEDAVAQLAFSCRAAFERKHLRPIGFRSPRSHWDMRLCHALARLGFQYSAEHDHAKRPYVLVDGPSPFIRIPICTDDRGLRRREETHDLTISKHHRYLRKAVTGRHFVSIAFHPWLLAEEPRHMEHWREWIDAAVGSGARIGPLRDVIPAE